MSNLGTAEERVARGIHFLDANVEGWLDMIDRPISTNWLDKCPGGQTLGYSQMVIVVLEAGETTEQLGFDPAEGEPSDVLRLDGEWNRRIAELRAQPTGEHDEWRVFWVDAGDTNEFFFNEQDKAEELRSALATCARVVGCVGSVRLDARRKATPWTPVEA